MSSPRPSRYGDIKATELAVASRDIAESVQHPGTGDDWGTSVSYWIDKTCILQGGHPLMRMCVGMIEVRAPVNAHVCRYDRGACRGVDVTNGGEERREKEEASGGEGGANKKTGFLVFVSVRRQPRFHIHVHIHKHMHFHLGDAVPT